MSQYPDKKIIGRAEVVGLPELAVPKLHARIDTGARTSALWASGVHEKDGQLTFALFGPESPLYTGQLHSVPLLGRQMVASSNGHLEERYVIRTLVVLEGKRIRAKFTLADRSTQVYPVLIGRNVLRGKFVVDVKRGEVLKDEEKRRIAELKSKLSSKER